ncbi:hypothetical protein CF165_31335 [Amycolatopsis vastitatis]|uniref:Ricin B lectin domain-containing protein n=1 Tax=Amycolatopsis vastitatis TaxID=1905142 RepID=A0A229SWZ0_9PSEU|nr:hypothetical protein CF165_31335 [Amycolatopsis vastitatis]
MGDGNRIVRNLNSLLCIDVSGVGNNLPVYQNACSSAFPAPIWYFRNVGGDNYQLVNQRNGRCLAMPSSSTKNGEVAITWDCANIADQYWTVVASGDVYRFVNVNSGKCLAIGGSRTDVGAKAIQWTYAGIADQQWRFY